MMSPEDILRLIKKEVEEQTKDLKNRLGEVVDLFENGTAKIQFYGDQEPSEKEYAYLSTYEPKIGDEVALLKFADTYIIAGKNKFQEEPDVAEEIDLNNITGDLNVDGDIKVKNIVVSGKIKTKDIEITNELITQIAKMTKASVMEEFKSIHNNNTFGKTLINVTDSNVFALEVKSSGAGISVSPATANYYGLLSGGVVKGSKYE